MTGIEKLEENKLDIIDVFGQFEMELDKFESELKSQKPLTEEVEEFIFNSLHGFRDEVQDNLEFNALLSRLERDKGSVTLEDIRVIKDVLIDLRNMELNQADLDNLRESVLARKSEKEELDGVERDVKHFAKSQNIDSEKLKKLEAAKTKFVGFSEQIKGFKKQHPVWTKALISMLPASLTKNFFEEASEKSTNSSFDFSNILNQFNDALAGIAKVFFGFLAPKEMKDLLSQMKDFSTNLPEGFVDFMAEGKELEGIAGAMIEKTTDIVGDGLEKVKGGLYTYFSSFIENNLNPDMKKDDFDNFFDEFFDRMKERGYNIEGNEESFVSKLSKGDISIDTVFSGLGIGIMGIMDFVSLANENNVIDMKHIGMNLVEKSGEIIFESVMFFPHMANVLLGKGTLTELYENLKQIGPETLSDDYKNMILANIYRLLNFTTTGNILKNIASTPFHVASLVVGQLGEDVSKGKIALESLKGTSTTKLKVLGEIEQLLGGKGAFKEVMEISQEYERACVVSTAFAQSGGDYMKFKEILKSANLENLLDDETQLRKLSPENFKDSAKTVSVYLEEVSARVKAPLSQTKDILESARTWGAGIFSNTKLLQKATDAYSESLFHNAEMLKNDEIWKFFQKYPNLLKKAIADTKITNILDLASIQGEVKSIGGFFSELRVLVKQSPEFGKFIFGHSPIILLGGIHMKEMFSDLAKGELDAAGKEAFVFLAELTPIVGPITLTIDEGKEGHYMAAGANAIWIGIDTYILYKVARSTQTGMLKAGAKMTYKPILDTAKFTAQSFKAVGKIGEDAIMVGKNGFTKEALKVFGQSVKGKSGRIAFVLGLLATGTYAFEQIKDEFEAWDINNKIDTFAQIANQKGGAPVMERYLISNWDSFDEEFKEGVLIYVFNSYIGDSLNPVVKSVNVDDTEKYIQVTEYYSEYRNTLVENMSRFEGIADKLGYNLKLTGKDGEEIYV